MKHVHARKALHQKSKTLAIRKSYTLYSIINN